ncbi:MAG: hypothetical protein WCT77_02985 [Bacteroidota bacterium]|jgi:hypothetical protein
MNFTNKEIEKLKSLGFEKTASSYSYEYSNGVIILTVEKTDKNEFTFYNDMCSDDDIVKANNNQTVPNLTWKELLEEIKGSF